MIVVDSSAFLKFLMKEEGWEKIIPYVDPSSNPHAVDLLLLETANAIWKHVKKLKRITREQGAELFDRIARFVEEGAMVLEPGVKYLREAFEIAIDHDISIYDSLFIAQARNLKAELVTSDKIQKEVSERLGLKTIYVD